MDVSGIFSYARSRSYTDAVGKFTDANLLTFLNVRYHKIENAISQLKEDYFYDILTANVVANQQRYTLKSSTSSAEWVKKIINTYIKWSSSDQYPTKLSLWNTDTDSRSLEEISAEQSKDDWFYMVRGSEIIIYPTPLNSVGNGLTQEVIVNLKDLATTSVEADVFATSVDWHSELRQYHYIIWLWVAADIFWIRWMFNEKVQLENEFEIELSKMVWRISDRYTSPIEGKLLDVSYYK